MITSSPAPTRLGAGTDIGSYRLGQVHRATVTREYVWGRGRP